MQADLVVLGGRVVTQDGPGEVEAVAIRGDRILEVGPRDRIEALVGHQTRILDVDGCTVVPGLGDAHAHLIATGLAARGVDVFGVGSLKRTLDALAEAAEGKAKGEWIVGSGFDETMVADRRYPTALELDEAVPGHPVLLVRADGHSSVLNTLAMEKLGLRPPLEGMEVDPHGRPTGVMRHTANSVAQGRHDATIAQTDKRAAFLEACRLALRRGLTTVHDIEAQGPDVDLVLGARAETPLRVLLYSIADDVASIPTGCRGLKLFVDGSMDSHTGLLEEPYADNPSTAGVFYKTPAQLETLVAGATSRGLQIMAHAIGDRAIREILEVYGRHPAAPGSPHRIEHYELPLAEHNDRCARDGVVVSIQPAFVHLWDYGGFYEARTGVARAKRIHPYQTLRRKGVVLAGGSDSPVTPLDPLLGMHGAVNHPIEAERLTAAQALEAFTLGVARAAGEERRGRLAPGWTADLTVLDHSPLDVPPAKIKGIGVVATVASGQVAHDARWAPPRGSKP